MVNDNQSREGSSRQQSAERAQTGSTTQQGTGTGGQRGTSQVGSGTYGSGSAGQSGQGRSGYGEGAGRTAYDQGGAGQGAYARGGAEQGASGQGGYGQRSQGTSTWQGGRYGPSGGALQRRGSTSPYASDYASGYGGGPFSIMRRISDEMDRLFDNFGMGRALMPGGLGAFGQDEYGQGLPSMWSPHVDVCERNGKLLIEADLPGLRREDIHVRIEDDTVVIEGERNQQQTSDQSGYYRSERSYGRFYRTIPLPEGANAETATASFRDGVLEIELDAPKQPQQRGRSLEIRDAGTGSSARVGQAGATPQGGYSGTGSASTHGSTGSGSNQGGDSERAQDRDRTGGSQE